MRTYPRPRAGSLPLPYHSAHGISNIPSNIRRMFPVHRLPLAGRQSTFAGVDDTKPRSRRPKRPSTLIQQSIQLSTVDTSIPCSARHFEHSIEYSTYVPCRQTAIGWPTVDSGTLYALFCKQAVDRLCFVFPRRAIAIYRDWSPSSRPFRRTFSQKQRSTKSGSNSKR